MKNLKIIESRPGYYWYYVPDDKFIQHLDDDVFHIERAGDEVNGWIFFRYL